MIFQKRKEMTVKEKFGQITEDGAKTYLNYIDGIDEGVTVGDLRAFLETRKVDAAKGNKSAAEFLIKKLDNKIIKMRYSDTYSQIVRVDSVKIIQKYGRTDAKMKGEAIVLYEGSVRIETLKDAEYSNYFYGEYNESYLTIEQYNELRDRIELIKSNMQS